MSSVTSAREIARQLGISHTAIQKAERAGRITREPNGAWDIEKVCQHIMARDALGKKFAIVVVAEGARFEGEVGIMGESLPGQAVRVGGVAERIARAVQARTGKECRSLVLGHLQRGGMPTGYDRMLATRFGGAATEAVAAAKWGHVVALQTPHIVPIPIVEALKERKRVDPAHDTVRTARKIGISFGD